MGSNAPKRYHGAGKRQNQPLAGRLGRLNFLSIIQCFSSAAPIQREDDQTRSSRPGRAGRRSDPAGGGHRTGGDRHHDHGTPGADRKAEAAGARAWRVQHGARISSRVDGVVAGPEAGRRPNFAVGPDRGWRRHRGGRGASLHPSNLPGGLIEEAGRRRRNAPQPVPIGAEADRADLRDQSGSRRRV